MHTRIVTAAAIAGAVAAAGLHLTGAQPGAVILGGAMAAFFIHFVCEARW